MAKYPAHSVAKSNPILQELRAIKHSIEIDLMQQACNITEKGFRRVLNFIKLQDLDCKEANLQCQALHQKCLKKL